MRLTARISPRRSSAKLIENARQRIDRHAQQRRFQFFERMRAGEHIGDEPARRIRQRTLAQRRDQPRLDDARLAAAARPDQRQKARAAAAARQAAEQLLGQRGATEEGAGVGFLESAQAFVGVEQVGSATAAGQSGSRRDPRFSCSLVVRTGLGGEAGRAPSRLSCCARSIA